MLPNCDNSTANRTANVIDSSRAARFYCGEKRWQSLAATPINLNVEVPDLLPQRIAVEAEQVGRTNLVAARGRQRRGQQRNFDLLEDAVVEARRRHAIREAGEVRRQV